MDIEREAIHYGKFGYETFNGIIIPFTFRNNEKYCAKSIFWWHFNKQNVKLRSNLIDFGYLKTYKMHDEEADLWNDINEWHNDSMYPYTFSQNDALVKLEDVRDIFKYVAECGQKLELGTQFTMTKGGMFRMQLNRTNIYLPYLRRNSQCYVPVRILFPLNAAPKTLDVTKLTGIDVMYLRFLLDVLEIQIASKIFEMSCVILDQLVAYLRTKEGDYDVYYYWPSKKCIRDKVNDNLSIFTKTLNNKHSVQKKVAVKQKNAQNESTVVKSPMETESKVAFSKHKSDETQHPKRSNEELKLTAKKPKTNEVFYEVDEIVDYENYNGIELVRIRWTGYSSADDTWEPLSSLNDVLRQDVIQLRARKTNANMI